MFQNCVYIHTNKNRNLMLYKLLLLLFTRFTWISYEYFSPPPPKPPTLLKIYFWVFLPSVLFLCTHLIKYSVLISICHKVNVITFLLLLTLNQILIQQNVINKMRVLDCIIYFLVDIYRIPPNCSTPLFLGLRNMLCHELIFIFFV